MNEITLLQSGSLAGTLLGSLRLSVAEKLIVARPALLRARSRVSKGDVVRGIIEPLESEPVNNITQSWRLTASTARTVIP